MIYENFMIDSIYELYQIMIVNKRFSFQSSISFINLYRLHIHLLFVESHFIHETFFEFLNII